jgi:hypothetical protein
MQQRTAWFTTSRTGMLEEWFQAGYADAINSAARNQSTLPDFSCAAAVKTVSNNNSEINITIKFR